MSTPAPARRDSPVPRPVLASAISALLLLGSVAWAVVTADAFPPVAAILLAAACASEILAVRFPGRFVVTGWDWCYLLAIFFPGGAAAIAGVVAATLAGWLFDRYRLPSLLLNLAAVAGPVVVGSLLFDHLDGPLGFLPATVAATLAVIGLHIVVAFGLIGLLDGVRLTRSLGRARTIAVPFGLQAAFAIGLAGVYRRYGVEAVFVAVVFGGAFVYMTQLLVVARERATAHANLSWGVLSGLIRTLEMRDPRSARHCAAVARFSRDIARAAGLSKADQDLAHTAGLLHDIGKFALSDRVLDGDGLTEADWRAIRRHPAIGADLLKDISVYGPVGEIVGAHHERWDGRGYPNRIAGEDIPEIARIVAVAEVYDTLTAPDTYRTPKNSFEALNTLREASGRQFDPRFVEALATVLAGRDVAYRHADDADFDAELDIQRRMSEAAST
ncbi:HD domain-containing protein [Paraconexibacter antarcticus]|uniref:HD domain-containing protein n=1 Tax=Paraconexibacter antarcticus TaxID=2949664 RepID=A0ABY5DTQ0_9ACTN|nr:HD domain-containing phosphohydrolase [Paraconexibacter antarcticus]UTI64462.1 HD domain-containing protein [Paraconexibacter antarcticus]